MTSIISDVSPAVASLIITHWRETPIWQKLSYVNELNETVNILALSDLRRQYPWNQIANTSAALRHAGLVPNLLIGCMGRSMRIPMQPTEVLLLVTETLEALSIPYCVGGSFVSSAAIVAQ